MVSPLRWLHSLVTSRIATIGRITDIGNPIAAAKLSKVRSLAGAQMMTAPVARTAVIAMLAISQNPERVSNILRNSTLTIRLSGIGGVGVADTVSRPVSRSMVMVLMLLLLLVVSLR